MGLRQWEGWRDLKRLHGEVNKLFDRVNASISPDPSLSRVPRVDICENSRDIVVIFEIPGIDNKEDLEITVTDDIISIQGQSRRGEVGDYHCSERYYGPFSRILQLPTRVISEQAKANYSNGILEIRVPKAPKVIGKQVKLDL